MTGRIRLDVHAHLAPVVADRLQELEAVSFDPDGPAMVVDGHRVGLKPLFEPDRLIRWMDDNQVEHAWISAPPPLYRQHLRGEPARRWTDYLNDGLARIAASSGSRLSPLMHLPTESPDIAASIAGDLIGEGNRRFSMPCGTGDERTLGMPEFEPLWQVLDDTGAFVFFHPGECCDGRLKSFYLANLLGNPYESGVAIAHLVFSGVLDRYRRITLCFAHGAGVAPMVAGRMQRGFDTDRPGLDKSLSAPSELFKRFHVDCICHNERTIGLAEEVVGEGNVVFGSDWPFPMGVIEPETQLGGYDPERLKRIVGDNPDRLLAHLDRQWKELS